jgi:transcriptional regulator, cro/CI family|nr:MAG TPA: repressor protein [Bacteriophage sp.]
MLPVYEAVKKLCKSRGLSFNEVEEGIGVGKNTLYGLKRNHPSMDRVMQLADFFDVSVDFLLGRTDQEKPDRETIKEALESENLKELEFDEFFSMDIKKDGQKITDRDKRIIKSMIDAYLKESTI